jgi:hypothetical protein
MLKRQNTPEQDADQTKRAKSDVGAPSTFSLSATARVAPQSICLCFC